jgi:3-methyladenine DNA glycosylase AlkD
MTRTEVMKELKANGTAQNVKVYRRHGVQGKLFGVSYAVLGQLKKKIKTDQSLAEQLWATGNHDARALATMIADPGEVSAGLLNAWVKDVDFRGMAGALSNVAAETPSAKGRMEQWTKSRDEMIACTGWHTLASIARQNNGLPDAYFSDWIKTIEAKVHTSKNWAKYAMNNALISIGVRNAVLEKRAIAAAKRIGTIEVDHGETGCKTPEAAAYIKKTLAHQRKKQKKAN